MSSFWPLSQIMRDALGNSLIFPDFFLRMSMDSTWCLLFSYWFPTVSQVPLQIPITFLWFTWVTQWIPRNSNGFPIVSHRFLLYLHDFPNGSLGTPMVSLWSSSVFLWTPEYVYDFPQQIPMDCDGFAVVFQRFPQVSLWIPNNTNSFSNNSLTGFPGFPKDF